MRLKPKLDLSLMRARRHEFVGAQADLMRKTVTTARLCEPSLEECRERTETALPAAELRIVQLAAAQLRQQAQDVLGAIRVLLAQRFQE